MQMMKSSIEKPYYSDKPLSDKTRWIAFPIEIYVRNQDYSSALSYGKEIIQKLESIVKSEENEGGRVGNPDIIEDGYDFETALEFKKLGNDCSVKLYYQVVVNFSEGLDFWIKMVSSTKFLDSIEAFCESYTKDKLVDITLGSKYVFSKL